MIVSKLIKIEKTLPIDNISIEKDLKTQGIEPIRWAIVKVSDETLTINVAYAKM